MRKFYKILLAPMMLYSISSSYTYADDINSFNIKAEILSNGDISVNSSISKSNNACIYLSSVQILRNYESEVASDIDGTPILSRWETTWENTGINQLNIGSPKVNLNKAKALCLEKSNSPNNSLTSTILNEVNSLIGNEKRTTQNTFKNWPITLNQGGRFLGHNMLNQSSNYEDAELKVSAIFIKNPNGNHSSVSPTGSKTSNKKYKISTLVINLRSTLNNVALSVDHKLTYPGFVQGKKIPLAYMAAGKNLGCIGRVMPTNSSNLSVPGSNKIPAIRVSHSNQNRPKFDCYYATRSSQKANITPQIVLLERSPKDVLIMCPGSTIPDELNYTKFRANKANIPTGKSAPYLQVKSPTYTKWCMDLEKIERKWTNLHSVSNQGWLVSLNKHTNNLECATRNSMCINTLSQNTNSIKLMDTSSKLVKTESRPLRSQSSSFCEYKDGSISNCPVKFNSQDNETVNDLIQALQFEAMHRSIN